MFDEPDNRSVHFTVAEIAILFIPSLPCDDSKASLVVGGMDGVRLRHGMSDDLHERIHRRCVQARLISRRSRLRCKRDSFSRGGSVANEGPKKMWRAISESILSELDDIYKLELTRMRK